MKTIFVTSSGTDIGKTYVTVNLLRALLADGMRADALKPLITDYTDETAPHSDTALILEALGRPFDAAEVERVSPWRYTAALAPDMAAAREGHAVPYEDVLAFCRARQAEAASDVLLVEGAGGVLAPVDESHAMRDFMLALGAQPVLVVGSYLGTISHTLTAVEALANVDRPPLAVIVSESPDTGIPLADTCAAIGRFLGGIPLLAVARDAKTVDPVWRKLADIIRA